MSSSSPPSAISHISPDLPGGDQAQQTFQALFPLQIARLEEIQSVRCTQYQYGPNERHQLDVFTSNDSDECKKPVIIFLHSGGLTTGDKRMQASKGSIYQNVGEFFVKSGYACVTINYRLQPAQSAVFPDGGEDVSLVLRYLSSDASLHPSLDLSRIFFFGSTAGSIHISTYLWCPISQGRSWPQPPHTAAEEAEQGFRIAGFICANLPADFKNIEAARETVTKGYFGEGWKDFAIWNLRSESEDTTETLMLLGEIDLPEEVKRPVRELVSSWETKFNGTDVPLPQLDVMEGHNHYSMPVALGLGAPYDDWTPRLFKWLERQQETSFFSGLPCFVV